MDRSVGWSVGWLNGRCVCRPHAKCSGCNDMKRIGSEDWTQAQVKKHNSRGDKFICKACKGTWKTRYNTDEYKCKACGASKGRSHFKSQDLKDQKKKEMSSYLKQNKKNRDGGDSKESSSRETGEFGLPVHINRFSLSNASILKNPFLTGPSSSIKTTWSLGS